jgi:hypothetical protein
MVRLIALLMIGGAMASSSSFAQLWGTWPMGGNDIFHSGSFASASSPPTYTSGAQKWAKTLPNGAVATTGVVIGTKDDPNTYEYRFYVGANDDKVYCYQVSYSGGTFSVGTDPVWTYTCDGDPVGTPVLA